MTFSNILHVFLHALKDSAYTAPFLLATYILIEYLQRNAKVFKNLSFLSGTHAPLLGALSGIFPQCGFSVMSAKLYDNGVIKLGTLLAVFIATSDEAFALLLTSGEFLPLLFLILFKLIYAIGLGYLVNIFAKKALTIKYKGSQLNFRHEEFCRQCGNSSKATSKLEAYLFYPLLHTLKTFLFVFAVNFVFAFFIEWLGEENIALFLQKALFVQPFVCSLVGLIPNCASSILITQLYISGGITFGSMFAGLCANAGIGLAIVLKSKKNAKYGIILLSILYLASAIAGILLNAFAI